MRSHQPKRGPRGPKFQIMQAENPSPPTPIEAPIHLSRPQAVAKLREKLVTLVDAEHCVCSVASRLGLPCGGFSQFSDEEFKARFSWIASNRPHATRQELEEAVNAYLVGRQQSTGAAIACDVETRDHDVCGGWNTFDNPTLEAFYQRVFGRPVRIG